MTTAAHHFAYLFEGQKAQIKIAAERLELFAKVAAKRYLEEGAGLTDTITKQAKQNDLNPEQVRRVCEMANIETHKGLWAKTAQKNEVSFPLADSKVVLACCGDAPSCPVNMDSDYAGPPKGIPTAADSLLSMVPGGGHDGLTQEPERKQIIVVMQKKAFERKALHDKLIYQGMELESLEKRAYHLVKQTVLGGASFRQVYAAAVGAGLGKIANEYLPKFQDQLIKEAHGETRARLVKTAIAKAPDDLISDNLGNVTIINGAHPVLISLDTIRAKTGEIKNGLHNILRIDDEVQLYNQRLHEL